MPKKGSLVEQIEQDALDGGASLAGALRKCIALGGRAGSAELRDWATRELQGYDGPAEEVPNYRKLTAPILLDGFAGGGHIKGQLISSFQLPQVVQDAGISENIVLRQGAGELEDLVQQARREDHPIRLGLPPGTADLLNHENTDPYQHVERLYWGVASAAVVGVLDQIRTRLVALVAEIRAAAPDPDDPSEAAATNAVNVAVYGKARDINVNAAQAGAGNATAAAPPRPPRRPWWRRARTIGAFIVGLATIAAAVFTYVQLQH